MIRPSICKGCSGPVSRQARRGLCVNCYLIQVPADFIERAATTRRYAMLTHYGVTESVMDRWFRDTGIKAMSPSAPVPDDFAAIAPTMGVAQLSRYYGRVNRVIQRWLTETNTQALKNPPRPRSDYAPRQPQARPIVFRRSNTPPVPARDTSLHGSAAEHLRRFTPVYRCQEKGAADQRGEFYRYGNAVLTPDELLQRAQRHGWEARG